LLEKAIERLKPEQSKPNVDMLSPQGFSISGAKFDHQFSSPRNLPGKVLL